MAYSVWNRNNLFKNPFSPISDHMEKELAHYMKFDGLLPENEPVAKNDVPESKVEVQCSKSKQSFPKTTYEQLL